MSDTVHETVITEPVARESDAQAGKFTMDYVLEQIEKIASQTEHLNRTLEKLGEMADGENAEHMSPGNTLGQAKAKAFADIVRCRETTNQQLIRLYEKMYDDLKPRAPSELSRDKETLLELMEAKRRIDS